MVNGRAARNGIESSRLANSPNMLVPLGKGTHLMVQGAVRSREYERDGVKHRVFELRADTIAKLDRAEWRHESDVEPDANEK